MGQHFTEFIGNVWSELERRARLLGVLGFFTLGERRLTRTRAWNDCLPFAYLLVLSGAAYFPSLRRFNSGRYVEQGELFEDFCCHGLNHGGWQTARTGWSSREGARKLDATVAAVAAELDELDINTAQVALDRGENEAGCDLVCHRSYRDGWTGRPVVLVQCASGIKFHSKLGTPSIDRWRNYIGFSTIPLRGFCTPLAFPREDFRRHSCKVSGLLLDRYRLLEPFAHEGVQLPATLSRRIAAWLRPRLKVLPILK